MTKNILLFLAVCAMATLRAANTSSTSDYTMEIERWYRDCHVSESNLIDLEKKTQAFVLETKKIDIPGYPDAFNPTVIRWQGSLLLCFRIYDKITRATDQIGIVRVDEEFNLLEAPQILEFRYPDPTLFRKRQDPRLIQLGDRLYIVYNNVIQKLFETAEIRRMMIAEVDQEGDSFYVKEPSCLTKFEIENPQRTEKNWVPFEHNGRLLLAYSLFPHRVLEVLLGTDMARTVAISASLFRWDWGVLRGGTPALQISDEEYLGFFHSSANLTTIHGKGERMQHYFMGAYTFSAKEPFRILRVSPEPIIGKNFYHGAEYKTWKSLRVVFPGGFIFDNEHIWIAYGRQDHEIWIAKLDRKGLLDSLRGVLNP